MAMGLFCSALLLFIVGIEEAKGQFIVPQVRVESNALGDAYIKDLDRLERRVTEVITAFAPRISCIAPTHPIPCDVTLLVTEVVGTAYKSDLMVRFYRPIYDRDERTILLQAGERGMTFDFDPYTTVSQQLSGLPDDPFFRHLYYYMLVGGWLYYDSFADQGGEPFVSFMTSNTAELQRSMGHARTFSAGLVPEVLLPELRSDATSLFREAYYLYHRKGIDHLTNSSDALERALPEVLDLLEELRRSQPSHPLLTLFADAKIPEMRRYVREDTPEGRGLRLRLLELFPSF